MARTGKPKQPVIGRLSINSKFYDNARDRHALEVCKKLHEYAANQGKTIKAVVLEALDLYLQWNNVEVK